MNYGDYTNIKGGYLDGTINRNKYGDTDWMRAPFRKFAPQTRHSVAIRGGSETIKYYVSADYSYQEPAYRNTEYNFQTAQVRSNLDAQITKDLKVSVELSGRNEKEIILRILQIKSFGRH